MFDNKLKQNSTTDSLPNQKYYTRQITSILDRAILLYKLSILLNTKYHSWVKLSFCTIGSPFVPFVGLVEVIKSFEFGLFYLTTAKLK